MCVIGLFKLTIWSWFKFRRWNVLRKLFFCIFQLGRHKFLKYALMIIWIYSASFVMTCISYLNFLILISHLFYLVNLVKDFSLIIFSMEWANFIDFFLFVSVSFWFLSLIISCHLLFWFLFLPFVLELSGMLLNTNVRSLQLFHIVT